MTPTPAHVLLAGRLAIIQGRLPLALSMTAVISIAFGILLAQVLPIRPVIFWVGSLQVVSLLRVAGWYAYRRANPEPERAAYWAVWFRLGAAGAALTWSMGTLFLLGNADPQQSTMLVITIMAVSAVAVTTLGPDFPSVLVFLSLALCPVAVRLLLSSNRLIEVSGLAVTASLVALCAAALRLTKDTTKMLQVELTMSELVLAESQARAAAEEANQAKSMFLANMSHEVRTPLHGVLGMTELLITSATDAEQLARLSMLRASASNLLVIVNDILDVSKVEAGKLDVEVVSFDLPTMLDEVSAFVSGLAERKGLTFSCTTHGAVPRFVLGDHVRLRQVLHNLGTNAVKFTATGSVDIGVTVASTADTSCELHVAVRDTGIGIPAAMIGKLFQPFVQADSSTSRRFGGTGLGLSISQRLMALMGGTIGLDSVDGRGSTFWFRVPLAVVADGSPTCATVMAVTEPTSAREPGATDQGTGTRRAPRVLVVEDNEVNQILAREILRSAGCEVDLACNGLEAIDARFRDVFDVVFMDCQMPVLDGLEATRRIRKREQAEGTSRTRIVALTANAIQGDRERCLAAGVDDYLTKPYTPAGLLAMMR